MKRYRTYTAKKLKLPRRLLFFFIVAVLIFVFAVILGNVLKNKVEKSGNDGDNPYDLTTEKAELSDIVPTGKANHDPSMLSVCGCYLDVSSLKDEAAAYTATQTVKEAGYNTVSFRVNYDSGNFTYASPVLQAKTRLPASEKLFSFELLKTVCRASENLGLRMSAVLSASDNTDLDCAVAEELYSIGFDEIIITGFESVSPDSDGAAKITGYINALREKAPVSYGVSISKETLANSKNAPFTEKVFADAEFFALDMREEDAASVSEFLQTNKGSFSAYYIRPLLQGSAPERAAGIRKVLKNSGVNACQYMSTTPPKPAVTTAKTETEEDEAS